ncbi:DNA gyrase subunit A [Caldinitratiruptor microaerophilus]
MQVVSRQVVTFLRGLGLGGRSAQREIPPAVLQSPQPVAAAFLRGLFEGDGAVERSGRAMLRASLVSASRTLLRQVQTLLLRFGIVSMLRRDESRGTYRLLLVGRRNLQAFAEKIGFVSPAKQEALAQALRTYSGRALSRTDFIPFLSDFVRTRAGRGEREWLSRHNFDRPDRLAEALPRLSRVMAAADLDWIRELAQGTYFFDQVIAVEDAGEHTVYSIRVDSACHSFVANGFVNHNTEARLSRIAGEMLRDIDKDTVDFVDNYDNSLREPVVLPSRFPNLLVNGSSGIAVGMATNIPPHNLGEVIDALFAMIDRPQITSEELMAYVKGPDFPTGALILGRDEIRKAYTTGRGSITLRARAHIEVDRRDRSRILITELPYMVNKAKLIARIAELVREHKIEGITDLRDESDRTGLRIAIEVRRDASARVILNLLYKHTPLQTTFPVHMLALVDGRPRTLNLRDALWHYLQHQKDVIVRRSRFDLKKAEDRAHIVEGLLKALDVIDEVIRTIRESPDTDTARTRLMQRFGFTEVQAQHILDMQLRRLTALERNKLEEEYQELQDRIAYLRAVLASESLQYKIIRQELAEIKEKYADERRTRIVDESGELDVEDLVAQEDIVVTLTHLGYVKRMPVTTYRSQRRGGRGITGATTREEDFVEHLFITTTHHSLMFFTDRGRCFRLKAHEIPEASRTARGTALINLINLEPGEKIQAVIPIRDAEGEGFLFFATRQGYVKKTPLAEYANVRSSGLIAIRLEEGDGVVGVRRTTGQQEIILVSSAGYALRFHEDDVRPMGRDARGVKGIELDEGAAVIGMDVVQPDADLLVATRMAMGKRTPLAEYPTYRRGARGVKTFNLTARTGDLVAIKTVREQSELFLITERGILIRMPAAQVRQTGRIAQGVILMNLEPGDSLVAVAEALTRDDEDGE